jgi:hypothetical protein
MLKMDEALDAATRREMIDLCYKAAIQLRERMQQMAAARSHTSAAELSGLATGWTARTPCDKEGTP